MIRLTWDGTAEPVSRDQISGANGYREIFIFSVRLTTSRIGSLTRLIRTLLYYVMTILYWYMKTPCFIYPVFKNFNVKISQFFPL